MRRWLFDKLWSLGDWAYIQAFKLDPQFNQPDSWTDTKPTPVPNGKWIPAPLTWGALGGATTTDPKMWISTNSTWTNDQGAH